MQHLAVFFCNKNYAQRTFVHKAILTPKVPKQSAENSTERVSPILVALMSHSDSNFESLNISFKENKLDGVYPNSNGFCCCVRKKEGRNLLFSAECKVETDDLILKISGHLGNSCYSLHTAECNDQFLCIQVENWHTC